MIKVLFLCHGNICRSPMAEFVFRDLVKQAHLSDCIHVASCATSREEIGNPVHPGTKRKLKQYGITCDGKTARQLTKKDYEDYDYLLTMEQYNNRNAMRILGSDPDKKVMRLLDLSQRPRDIADPWYTGNFDETYHDVYEGCVALLNHIKVQL